MSLDTENQQPSEGVTPPVDTSDTGAQPADTAVEANETPTTESSPDISVPEYQEFSDTSSSNRAEDLARLQNIQITVSAELGRATIPIQELMQLGEGTVLELNREIDSPVELMAQGVKLASGEVVVVDGCFAIRITEVEAQN